MNKTLLQNYYRSKIEEIREYFFCTETDKGLVNDRVTFPMSLLLILLMLECLVSMFDFMFLLRVRVDPLRAVFLRSDLTFYRFSCISLFCHSRDFDNVKEQLTILIFQKNLVGKL